MKAVLEHYHCSSIFNCIRIGWAIFVSILKTRKNQKMPYFWAIPDSTIENRACYFVWIGNGKNAEKIGDSILPIIASLDLDLSHLKNEGVNYEKVIYKPVQ